MGRRQAVLLGLASAVLVFLGFRLFWFLTDDAFIAFRYVSNHMLGHGLVWNAPPFAPVEGYTSWLWVALLAGIWSLTGIEPPDFANYLCLAFGYATLLVAFRMVVRMELPAPLARQRTALAWLVLVGTVTNRTFLAWLSSGLETSLFNLCFTLWLYLALSPKAGRPRWVFWLSTMAALGALTRPDGLLLVAGTLALVGWYSCIAARRTGSIREVLLGTVVPALPLASVALHFLWRRSFYGEWLPNTYYAKIVSPWPESGLRYLASFILEYALWLWLAAALVWLVRRVRVTVPGLVVCGVVVAHLAYYTLRVGGDHFEYRVFSYLIPLIFVSFAWLAGRIDLAPRAVLALFVVFILASWPIPWVHYRETRNYNQRSGTLHLFEPLKDKFPPGVRIYVKWFDTLQAWLIARSVCMRHQEHKVFHLHSIRSRPPRSVGEKIGPAGRPVLAEGSVGVIGWCLPNVAIIDRAGLNDYVTARKEQRKGTVRQMAHERVPFDDYVECFKPNVSFDSQEVWVTERELTDEAIIACETEFRRRLETRPDARKRPPEALLVASADEVVGLVATDQLRGNLKISTAASPGLSDPVRSFLETSGEELEARLRVLVGPDGKPMGVTLVAVRPEGSPMAEAYAEDVAGALWSWVFVPAADSVAASGVVELTFRQKGAGAPAGN